MKQPNRFSKWTQRALSWLSEEKRWISLGYEVKGLRARHMAQRWGRLADRYQRRGSLGPQKSYYRKPGTAHYRRLAEW